jgi:predicted dehydrogenase
MAGITAARSIHITEDSRLNFGLIGFGLMGQQRLKALNRLGGHRVVAVYDPSPAQLAKLPVDGSIAVASSVDGLLANDEIETVIVAVPHNMTHRICTESFEAGKNVFCEKPLGRSTGECRSILLSVPERLHLGVGFNYRHYPGIQQVRRAIEQGDLGLVSHMRLVLGHGGRPGYEKEWKTSKKLCGGGALFDPGIHAIDLTRFLLGEIGEAKATLFRAFWKIDVEDNAFVSFETEGQRQVQAHISTTEWKNRMSIDVFGTDGCIQLRGRSGFYGPQVVRYTRRWGWMEQPPTEEAVTEYPREDVSFAEELRLFISRTEGREAPDLANGTDALRALAIVEELYSESEVSADRLTAFA